jgi:hypothetical protein
MIIMGAIYGVYIYIIDGLATRATSGVVDANDYQKKQTKKRTSLGLASRRQSKKDTRNFCPRPLDRYLPARTYLMPSI